VLVKEAMQGTTWRRHVPPLLLLLALGVMVVAIARPTATVTLPSQHETVILAMDVSGSMRATDVEPNRLVAAQNAAKAFVAQQPEHVRIGVVAFAGTATVAQAPTRNKEDIVAAIDRFQLQRATAIGSAIIVSLATLFPDGGYDVASFSFASEKKAQKPPNFKPVPPGSYQSAVIILLTDGQRTSGPDSVMAARLAAERGVRIYTVGVGTSAGATIGFEGWSMHMRLDEETLRSIADLTRGEYFYAGNGWSSTTKAVPRAWCSKLKTRSRALRRGGAALVVLWRTLARLVQPRPLTATFSDFLMPTATISSCGDCAPVRLRSCGTSVIAATTLAPVALRGQPRGPRIPSPACPVPPQCGLPHFDQALPRCRRGRGWSASAAFRSRCPVSLRPIVEKVLGGVNVRSVTASRPACRLPCAIRALPIWPIVARNLAAPRRLG
jgi:Ca-activated chloride channel family protein